MDSGGPSHAPSLRCAGCGADLAVEPDQRMVGCEFCHASNLLDLSGVVLVSRLTTTHDTAGIEAAVLRWLRERGIPEEEVSLALDEELLVPFWSLRTPEGERSNLAIDQVGLPLEADMVRPGGQLERFEIPPWEDSRPGLIEASVPLEAALARAGLVGAEVQPAIVYAPFRRCTYQWRGERFELLVDAAMGRIHAFDWPVMHDPDRDRRLGLVMAAAGVWFLLVFFFVPGFLVSLLVAVVTALPFWWMLGRLASGTGVGA